MISEPQSPSQANHLEKHASPKVQEQVRKYLNLNFFQISIKFLIGVATEVIKGRVVEYSLADLKPEIDHTW
jgi:hypothetical protein